MEQRAKPREAGNSSVKSAKRVIDILEYVGKAPQPVTMTDIVKALGIPKTSVHSLLKTLAATRYLVADENQRYRLGLRVFELGAAVDRTRFLVDAARSVLLRGASEVHLTCNLGILDGEDVYYIEKFQHPDSLIQINTRVGGRLPAYATAMGKVLLGGLELHKIDEYLKAIQLRKVGLNTITDREVLRSQIMHARSVGFAIDDEESHANVVCVAAAIRDRMGAVTAAVSITGLKAEMCVDGQYPFVPMVMEMAKAITKSLQ